MTTEQLLELDCRDANNQEKIQKALKLIKPLSKEQSNVPLEKIERVIKIIYEKYAMWLGSVSSDFDANNKCIIWRASVVENSKIIATVHGCTLYELLAKSAILMYSTIRKK